MLTLPDKLTIRQELGPLEALQGVKASRRFSILDNGGVALYAYEQSSLLQRFFFRRSRAMRIVIMDRMQRTQLVIEKEFLAGKSLCVIKLPNGSVIGHVRRKRWWSQYSVDVLDDKGTVLCSCIADLPGAWKYFVQSDAGRIGEIRKEWGTLGQELLRPADTFSIELSSVELSRKPLVLSAAFLIDLLRFKR